MMQSILENGVGIHLLQDYDGVKGNIVYQLRHEKFNAWSLVHPQGFDYAFSGEELEEMARCGMLKRWAWPEGAKESDCAAPIDPVDPNTARKQAQIVAIRAASPMRPVDGRTAAIDGLALFDAVRSPCLI